VQKNLEKLAVIIPCFNEEISIANVIRDIKINLDAKIEYEIYVIDNNSTDLTSRVALENGAKIIFEERIGKGFAVLTAFRKINADYYILIDGY
jgi:glycosyltransferase involved in cell wall biosynthesis